MAVVGDKGEEEKEEEDGEKQFGSAASAREDIEEVPALRGGTVTPEAAAGQTEEGTGATTRDDSTDSAREIIGVTA